MGDSLKGKTAVITGGGGVLCGVFGKALARLGARVALLDLNEDAAAKAANEICSLGGTAKGYGVNVLDRDSLLTAHKNVKADFGRCDILINGAGGNSPRATTDSEYYESESEKSFFKLDKEGFEFVFNLNIMGTLLPTQEFAADMTADGGCIVNISSMNAFTPLTKIPAYSAAKAAVSNLTSWLAVHFSKVGIRVNAIAPGFFATKQNEGLLFNADGTLSARSEKIISATPMGRFGNAEELIGTLIFLTDDKASGFVTGIVVPVDGGFSAYSGV